jgi:hypothetical protein
MSDKPAVALLIMLACGHAAASHDFCITRKAAGVQETLRAQLAFGPNDPGRDGAAMLAIEHFRQGGAWTVHLDDIGAEQCISARTVLLAPAVPAAAGVAGPPANPTLMSAARMASGLTSGVYMEIGRQAGNLTRSVAEVTNQVVCAVTGC